jgi:hypothetical protein
MDAIANALFIKSKPLLIGIIAMKNETSWIRGNFDMNGH